MKLYEIDNAIMALIDENGEIKDFDAFDALQIERGAKIENVGCWYKNLLSDAAAMKAEEQALAERRKSAENKAERLKQYLAYALNGEKFSTPRVALSWRKSEVVEVEDGVPLPDDLLTYKEPTPNKTAIKAAIKDGRSIPGCTIVEKQNIQIK